MDARRTEPLAVDPAALARPRGKWQSDLVLLAVCAGVVSVVTVVITLLGQLLD